MLQFITNDFFGGALKVEERIIYATLKDRTTLCLMTPDLLEILLVLPCTGIQHRQFIIEGDYNTVSNTF
jgi:hypothetical protein